MEEIIDEIKKINPDVLSMEQLMKKDGYINRVYRFLDKIKPGQIFSVSRLATKETETLFTATVKLYIQEVKECDISFIKDDFKQFRKN